MAGTARTVSTAHLIGERLLDGRLIIKLVETLNEIMQKRHWVGILVGHCGLSARRRRLL